MLEVGRVRAFKGQEGNSQVGEREQTFGKQVFGYTETEEHRGEPNKQASPCLPPSSCYAKVITRLPETGFLI